MGQRAEIEPRWLVSLMCQWARHELAVQDKTLGYASGSSWMRGLKSSPASCIDPTGYSARDFRLLDAALEDLRINGVNLWASMMMYYKPWVVRSFQAEGYPFANSTYYDRLHRGHREIAVFIEQIKEKAEFALKGA
jgi:hypothetical protein